MSYEISYRRQAFTMGATEAGHYENLLFLIEECGRATTAGRSGTGAGRGAGSVQRRAPSGSAWLTLCILRRPAVAGRLCSTDGDG